MPISAAQVKELRELTSAPMLDCKKALDASDGNVEKAREWLTERGLNRAAKKAGRSTGEGRIQSYIHTGNRVGVLIEVNCETDFVARGVEFETFCHELTLHIAMANPTYLAVEDVPEAVVAEKLDKFKAAAIEEGKPEHIAAKIAEGRLKKFFSEEVLLEQPFVKDDDITIDTLLNQTIGQLGENMKINRFARFELGN